MKQNVLTPILILKKKLRCIQSMYFKMFNPVTDALTALDEKDDIFKLPHILKQAQIECEEIYIAGVSPLYYKTSSRNREEVFTFVILAFYKKLKFRENYARFFLVQTNAAAAATEIVAQATITADASLTPISGL